MTGGTKCPEAHCTQLNNPNVLSKLFSRVCLKAAGLHISRLEQLCRRVSDALVVFKALHRTLWILQQRMAFPISFIREKVFTRHGKRPRLAEPAHHEYKHVCSQCKAALILGEQQERGGRNKALGPHIF